MTTCLTLEHLQKTYRGHWLTPTRALQDVSFDISPGETVGLLGGNGAGKTTTFRAVAGLIGPTSGRIVLFGRPPQDPEARRRLGFLPENPRFHEFLTGEEYVDLMAQLAGVPGSERKRRVQEVLDTVGLGAPRRRRIRTYSKGMQQRVGVAQALVGRPDLVILDEPMTGLDPVGRREMRDLIRGLDNEGAAVLFSSHVLTDVELTCQRIVMLSGGRVACEGRLDELLAGVDSPVEVSVEGLDATAVAAAAREASAQEVGSVGERVVLLAPGARDAEILRDAITNAGGRVVAVTPREPTLEDVFLDRTAAADSPTRSEGAAIGRLP